MLMEELDQANSQLVKAAFSAAIFFTLLAGIVIYYIVSYRRKHLLHQKEKKELQLQFEKEVRQAQLEISELTMQRIAQEIHDNVGQSLTLLNLYLNGLQTNDVNALQQCQHLVQRSLADLRSISKSLSTSYQLELGLENAVRRELEIVSLTKKLHTELIIHSSAHPIPPSANQLHEVIFLRCIQEAISNTIKYANATCLKVELTFSEDYCHTIRITDDGQGMDLAQTSFGVGLTSLRDRAVLLGGDLLLQSSPNQGTKLTITTIR